MKVEIFRHPEAPFTPGTNLRLEERQLFTVSVFVGLNEIGRAAAVGGTATETIVREALDLLEGTARVEFDRWLEHGSVSGGAAYLTSPSIVSPRTTTTDPSWSLCSTLRLVRGLMRFNGGDPRNFRRSVDDFVSAYYGALSKGRTQ